MDPPFRSHSDLPKSTSRVEGTLHTPSTSILTKTPTATTPSLELGKTRREKANITGGGSQPTQAQSLIADRMLGQFSFAPATQTTVVTTTTTTTTSFPPLMMKAPHHLHELDSKLYPLASSPTPQSMKRFCFDVGGRPTFFREADNTLDTLQEVRLLCISVIYGLRCCT